jgi:hypothetical protein
MTRRLAWDCHGSLGGCHPHGHHVHVTIGNAHSHGFPLGVILLLIAVAWWMDRLGMFPDGM